MAQTQLKRRVTLGGCELERDRSKRLGFFDYLLHIHSPWQIRYDKVSLPYHTLFVCYISTDSNSSSVVSGLLICGCVLRPGNHQFKFPSRRIVAGTRRTRIMVLSIRTAMVRPRPYSCVVISEVNIAEPEKRMNNSAALVIVPAVFSRPRATAWVLLPVCNHSSRIRLSRKTS